MTNYLSPFQDILDHVVKALVEQGEPSRLGGDADSSCAYRGSYGRKCAAGHLIDDAMLENNNPEMQYIDTNICTFHTLMEVNGLVIEQERLNFIMWLQNAHDNAAVHLDPFVTAFLKNAKQVAIDYNLEWKFDDNSV